MTLVHAESYEVAFRWANLMGLDEWAFVKEATDITRHRNFTFVSLAPMSKALLHALMYVRANGGKVKMELAT
jgi:hypothetical protein